jgi:hypothetical protein
MPAGVGTRLGEVRDRDLAVGRDRDPIERRADEIAGRRAAGLGHVDRPQHRILIDLAACECLLAAGHDEDLLAIGCRLREHGAATDPPGMDPRVVIITRIDGDDTIERGVDPRQASLERHRAEQHAFAIERGRSLRSACRQRGE